MGGDWLVWANCPVSPFWQFSGGVGEQWEEEADR